MSSLSTVCLGRHHTVKALASSPTYIKSLRAYTIKSREQQQKLGGGADCHSQSSGHWIIDSMIANPMSLYQKYKSSRLSWGINALGTTVAEVQTQSGVKGYGITIGGEPACYIIQNHLSRFVEGQDVRNTELIWDQMWRSTLPYGRKGLPIQALSAVDLALWDALGKCKKEPVYNLIGGKTKQKLPMYTTTCRPDLAKEFGFVGSKVALPYGPADGDVGMRKNVQFIAQHREKVGNQFPLMVDCYMSLNVRYTVQLARRLEPYNVKWLEQCLMPDDYQGWKMVRQQTRDLKILFTTGEHEYTRFGFLKLLQGRYVDVLQPDVSWVGGFTQARRIAAMASAFDVPVIPHGSGPYSHHLQISQVNCPMAEHINLSAKGDKIVPIFGGLFKDQNLPKDGYVTMKDEQKQSSWGFGLEIDFDNIELVRPYIRKYQQ